MARTRTSRPEAQPPAPRQIRSDGWTLPRQRLFLKVLTATGSVEEACAEVEMSRASAYRLRLHPSGKAFREAWARALVASVTSLREIAFERAVNGVEEPIMEDGRLMGYKRTYNDRLLMFLLKNYDGQSPVARTGGAMAASAWPQEALINSFDTLEEADVPDRDVPYITEEQAEALWLGVAEDRAARVNLLASSDAQGIEMIEPGADEENPETSLSRAD